MWLKKALKCCYKKTFSFSIGIYTKIFQCMSHLPWEPAGDLAIADHLSKQIYRNINIDHDDNNDDNSDDDDDDYDNNEEEEDNDNNNNNDHDQWSWHRWWWLWWW